MSRPIQAMAFRDTSASRSSAADSAPKSQAQRLLEAFPEIDPQIEPFGARILVQIRRAKNVSSGGIILTDETAETDKWNTQIAKVISLGPLAFRNRETMQPWAEGFWCNPGDYVRCPKYHGDRWEVPMPQSEALVPGEKPDLITFVIFRDLDIVGRITGDPLTFKAFIQ